MIKKYGLKFLDLVTCRPVSTLHLLSIAFLGISTFFWSGTKNLYVVISYAVLFCIVYFFFSRIIHLAHPMPTGTLAPGSTKRIIEFINISLVALLLLYLPIYFLSVGYIPIIDIALCSDYYQISRFRSDLFYDAPIWIRYCTEYVLKGLGPFYLLLLSKKQSQLFPYLLIALTIFATNLIAKSYVVILILPIMAMALFERRWKPFALYIAIIGTVLAVQVYLTNPHVWERPWDRVASEHSLCRLPRASDAPLSSLADNPARTNQGQATTIQAAIRGISNTIAPRIFSVPGQVTSQWLSTFPEEVPFLKGCGYRAIAPLRNCDFISIPRLIYDRQYPELVDQQQLKGTVTAAHFLNDYANFGFAGLLIAATTTALLILLIERLSVDRKLMLALTFPAVLQLIETTLTSVLHTGGLGIIIFLLATNRSDSALQSNLRHQSEAQ